MLERPAARPLWRRILRRLVQAIAVLVALGCAGLAFAYYRSHNDCAERAAAHPEHPRKAICYCSYGPADVLQLQEVEKPVPTDEQVLVKVRAAAANPLDWHFMRGTPYIMRLGSGLRVPAATRIGVDFSGVVESVGAKVTKFKPGDEVFGGRNGAFAEYVVVREAGGMVRKPANVTFEQAAGVGIAGVTALQALRDKGKVGPGTKVLINGASGGVGTFAVQIAKMLGAEVTGVCSGKNFDLVRSLGADHLIDYTKDDFTQGSERYDVIVDNVANHTLSEMRRVMKPDGRFVLVGGGGPDKGNWLGPLWLPLKAVFMKPFVSQQMGMFVADLTVEDLSYLAGLMESGKMTPIVDRTYPLAQTADAIRYLEAGHARGKVVITME